MYYRCICCSQEEGRTQKDFKGSNKCQKAEKGSLGKPKKHWSKKKMLTTLSELIKDRLDGDKILGYLDGQSGNGRDNFLDEMCNDKNTGDRF